MSPSPTTVGSAPFLIDGHTFHTHYRIFGAIGTAMCRPLVALHGGPGVISTYMEPFTQLTSLFNIPVILYDQFGCGTSLPDPGTQDREIFDKISARPGFWSIDLFIKELDNILKHLNMSDSYDLLGHSWGGMLAASYAIKIQPKGLKNIIFADSLACMQDWVDSSMELLISPSFGFPKKDRNIIKFAEDHPDAASSMTVEEYEALEKSGINLKSEEYQNSLGAFLKQFVLRIDPWPESWNQALTGSQSNPVGPIMCARFQLLALRYADSIYLGTGMPR
jgi:proline-specific peptidase